MITDHDGRAASFASTKSEAMAEIDKQLEGKIKALLGRGPAPGELERMGEKRIHPDGSWTFYLGKQPIMSVRFEGRRILIDDL